MTYVNSILDYYDRADSEALKDGANWYPAMHRIMKEHARTSSVTVAQAAAIYAATSINTPWARNLELAARAIAENGLTDGTLTMVRRKVAAILAGDDIDTALTADPKRKKLVNFRRNLSGDYQSVTVDRWAHHVATDGKVRTVPNGTLYDTLADAYRTAAAMRGVTPATMQAVTWVVARGKAD